MARNKGISICVTSAKGGVGKTATVLNLAGIFEQLEKKVLIIDFDLYSGGISIALDKNSSKTIFNYVDDKNNNRYTDLSKYITKYDDYISFISSIKDPREASKIDSKYIDALIEEAMNIYDVVLIDTNHVLNEVNLSILDKVTSILFVMTNDPIDLKNMKSLITIFKGNKITNYKVLLNNSINPFKEYFSLYDIKNVINTNIDYTISSNFYLKNYDNYVMDGDIITLERSMAREFARDYKIFMSIALDFLEEGENNA